MQNFTQRFVQAALLLACLCLSSCPGPQTGKTTGGAQQKPIAAPVKVTLIASDLGLGDGSYVREADSALKELAESGQVLYQPAGTIPAALEVEARKSDIGMPAKADAETEEEKLTLADRDPGRMELSEATALLDTAPACDLLVLSCAQLVGPAQTRAKDGKLAARAILLLDQDCWADREACQAGPLPVFAFSYDVAPVAFLAGVAASDSSNNASFIALASRADPQAKVWLDAVYAGAKWQSNGTSMMTATVPCGPDGIVAPADYLATLKHVREIAGPNFAVNHYLVALGRATPSIMYSLSSEPTYGYIASGWADYRQIRPASMIGCALKHPGNAIRWLFGPGAQSGAGQSLHALFDPAAGASAQGIMELQVGLAEDCVGFTDFDLYSRYNPDGADLASAVADVLSQIRAGELDVHAMMEKYKRLSEEELSR